MASNVFKRPELQDDERANVLYSPFRSKTLNPGSWTNKMNFWQQHLKETATENKTLIFDIDKLPNEFERKGIAPKCLPTVIEELQRSGAVKPLDDYKRPGTWLSWGFSVLVKQPLTWGLGQIVGSSKKKSSLYVWPHVLKNVAEDVLALHHANYHPGITSNLISYLRLRDTCSSVIESDDDFKFVMTHLEGEKKVHLIDTPKNGLLVKICDKGKATVTPINEQDTQIFEILEGQKKLEKETETLTSKVDELTKQAQSFVKTGKKRMALHCLRRRKLATTALERRYTMLNNLEEILQKIDDAKTNEMVVNACESGVATMKTMNKELPVDKVEAVMDDVREVLEDSEEIGQAISSGASTESSAEFNMEVEGELEMLLKETSTEESGNVEENVDLALPDLSTLSLNFHENLPDVPTHSPSSSNSSQSLRKEKLQDRQQIQS